MIEKKSVFDMLIEEDQRPSEFYRAYPFLRGKQWATPQELAVANVPIPKKLKLFEDWFIEDHLEHIKVEVAATEVIVTVYEALFPSDKAPRTLLARGYEFLEGKITHDQLLFHRDSQTNTYHPGSEQERIFETALESSEIQNLVKEALKKVVEELTVVK